MAIDLLDPNVVGEWPEYPGYKFVVTFRFIPWCDYYETLSFIRMHLGEKGVESFTEGVLAVCSFDDRGLHRFEIADCE